MGKKLGLGLLAVSFFTAAYLASAKTNICFAAAQSCHPGVSQPAQLSSSKHLTLYSPETLHQLLADHKQVILFFQASWCANCAQTEATLRQQLDQLPTDVVILSVNYDMNGSLAAKYGVTHQDMFVLLDQNENARQVWASQNDDIQEIQRYLQK